MEGSRLKEENAAAAAPLSRPSLSAPSSLLPYHRLFIFGNRDTWRENIALFRIERVGERKEGKPSSLFRCHLGEREFRYGPSRKEHNAHCATHCIDVSKICAAVSYIKTNVPSSLSLFLSSFNVLIAESAPILPRRQVQNRCSYEQM